MKISILLEIDLSDRQDLGMVMDEIRQWNVERFMLDVDYEPVLMHGDGAAGAATTAIFHGWVKSEKVIAILEAKEAVVSIWKDTVVEPMSSSDENTIV